MCEIELNSPKWIEVRIVENMKHTFYKLGLADECDVSDIIVEYEALMDAVRK